MNLTVIGTGYVGLVAGACLADMGNNVICVDNNIEKLEQLKQGIIPIYEPGLDELVKSNVQENRLRFSNDLDSAVKESQVCFIAVGTPQDENGAADLSGVFTVAEQIAKSMNEYKVIVNKSTVPVGTAQKVANIVKSNTNHPFDVVSNPEFLKQGNAVDDFLSPDRVIIGSDSEKATRLMQEIYSPFLRTANRIILMDVKSAEMTKYAANSFLATKISFMNEIANLCEKVGADAEMVRVGMSTDTRIGNRFLFPGIGYGGSCFPKDIEALINTGNEFGCEMPLVKSVNKINRRQRELFVKKITNRFGEDLNGRIFGVWGLAFKPKTNDMREAPAITIVNELIKRGAKVNAYDPKAMDTSKQLYLKDKITYSRNSYEALENADAMLLLTEWNEFRRPDFDKIKRLMKSAIIFDGRNQYDPVRLKEKGFEYICIGRNN
ncbi:MAG: UDP-glucose/GDP-mannose dehydrogenase family protein [Candidatus Gastranaerophilales bacterium]|nr:UDP-glucose/GDP-mannose dehydrogenase family protein [Candidatus Gastranaerophilales bacterium]MCM1072924.1 UDP-glucose/GDP-mannose dehydrogenase family protein [Bacteroides sp.]